MVEETDTGFDLRRTPAVEIDGNVDVGFLGRALDLGGAQGVSTAAARNARGG